jgi:hypothetical protein
MGRRSIAVLSPEIDSAFGTFAAGFGFKVIDSHISSFLLSLYLTSVRALQAVFYAIKTNTYVARRWGC